MTAPQDQWQQARLIAEQARARAAVKDWEAARQQLATAVSLCPDDAVMQADLAWYTHNCGKLAPAERQRVADRHLERAFQIDPRCVGAHQLAARIWSDRGDNARARAAMDKALRLEREARADAEPSRRVERPKISEVTITSEQAKVSDQSGPWEKSQSSGIRLTWEESPSFVQPAATSRQRGLTRALLAVLGALGLVTAIWWFVNSRPDPATSDLREKLGTRFSFMSVDLREGELLIDVGSSWRELPEAERNKELATIAGNAPSLQIRKVYVFSNGDRVAGIDGDQICPDPLCLSKAAAAPPAAVPAPP